ncbi:MAG: formylglycine-generating enzyme family protein, partial [Alloprevotella sp.]
RLPTEAEWEFAARGGNQSRHTQYSGSRFINDVAWYKSNSGSKTHPVKTKQPNELGIYDMSGNVWEWCLDIYTAYSSSAQTDPRFEEDSSGSGRVFRGGSWSNSSRLCRSSIRKLNSPDASYDNLGLRLVLSE